VHIQELLRCCALKIEQIIPVEVKLEEANVVLCGMNKYNTVQKISLRQNVRQREIETETEKAYLMKALGNRKATFDLDD